MGTSFRGKFTGTARESQMGTERISSLDSLHVGARPVTEPIAASGSSHNIGASRRAQQPQEAEEDRGSVTSLPSVSSLSLRSPRGAAQQQQQHAESPCGVSWSPAFHPRSRGEPRAVVGHGGGGVLGVRVSELSAGGRAAGRAGRAVLRQLAQRNFSSSSRLQLKNRVPELQKVFQEDNGLPVHLKGGVRDAVLYRVTMTLTVLGTGIMAYQLFQAAMPQNK
ncbi:unnamed protein product [Lampetra planeri]